MLNIAGGGFIGRAVLLERIPDGLNLRTLASNVIAISLPVKACSLSRQPDQVDLATFFRNNYNHDYIYCNCWT